MVAGDTKGQEVRNEAADSGPGHAQSQGQEQDQSPTGDEALVARLAGGDPEPLGELFLRHGGAILGVLQRYARGLSPQELEDLRQEVFLKALEIAPKYSGTGTVRAWLCGIAVQLGRNRRRRWGWRQRLLREHGDDVAPVARTNPVGGAVHAKLDVQRALEKVPEGQREVLLLFVVEQLSGPEIANVLSINEKTVWTRLHRARKTLRDVLEGGVGTGPAGKVAPPAGGKVPT